MEKKIEDYLHLYLGCEVVIESEMFMTGGAKDKIIDRLVNVYTDNGETTIDCRKNSPPTKDIKLLLRPLSDMTEEEKDEAAFMMGGKIPKVKMLDKLLRLIGEEPAFTPNVFFYLLSKHLDLFELIEAGLAIDKTKMK